MIEKAEKFYRNKKYKQAEAICLDIMDTGTPSVDVLRLQSLIMLKTDRIPQGIEFLKLALSQSPNDPQNNIAMGQYSMALQKLPEAINAFLRAYNADPNNTEALLYLGDLHSIQKNWNKAVVFYALYINIDPSNTRLNQVYANLLQHCDFKDYSDVQIKAMETALLDDGVTARKMNKHWMSAVLNLPAYTILTKAIIDRTSDLDALQPSLNSAFFAKGVEKLRHRNPAFELFLTHIRQSFLTCALNGTDLCDHHDFLYGLAMQCWTNEYVFYTTVDEQKNIVTLRKMITDEDMDWSNEGHAATLLYLYASYASPLEIENIESLVKKLPKTQNGALKKFIKVHVLDALEEKRIKKTIPHLTNIDDSVSQLVKDMYEESPYPRGVEPVMIDESMIDPTPMNILFAGCGTGHQILGFAQAHPNCTFTAIDLSSSSLAYAIRETRAKIASLAKKITFGLGDILKLDSLPHRYDRIYCTGVLHHMEDPEKGLASLKNILHPNGTMRLALYSETARQHVVQTRDYIAKHGYKNTKDDIRRFRHDILDIFTQKNHPEFIEFLVQMSDFYTLSECRDLVFHVQEHRYTIPQILDILEKHDLELVEFHIKHKGIKDTFASYFPHDPDALDPMNWHEYEQKHPLTFVEMYDFDVRHKQ